MVRRTTDLGWWAENWLDALRVMGWSARIDRGKAYARAGRVGDVRIEPGMVSARVRGSRPTPYRVEIRLPKLDEAVWHQAIGQLAGRASLAAGLLIGQAHPEIEEIFRAAGHGLFPNHTERMTLSCSCPDWERPCKHVAAVFFVVADELDKDPFHLFAMRGHPRDSVLTMLRARRLTQQMNEEPGEVLIALEPVRSLRDELSELLAEGPDDFWEMGAMPALPSIEQSDRTATHALSPSIITARAIISGQKQELPDVLRRMGPAPRGLGGTAMVSQLATAYQILSSQAAASLRPPAPSPAPQSDLGASQIEESAGTT